MTKLIARKKIQFFQACNKILNFLKLLKDYRNNDAVVVSLLNYYEFHILPVANPDGYENTHTLVSLMHDFSFLDVLEINFFFTCRRVFGERIWKKTTHY